MKPARFIFNSDYTTVRCTGEVQLSVTIPNDFTVPPSVDEYTIGTTTAVLADESDTLMAYYSSSRYNDYTTPGFYCVTIPEGSSTTSAIDEVVCMITVTGNVARLTVTCYNPLQESTVRFQGYGQTITAHIITYKDPFSA